MTKTSAAKSFAKQLGWQEAFTTLFILSSLENSDFDFNEIDVITMATNNSGDETNINCDSEKDSEVVFNLNGECNSAIPHSPNVTVDTETKRETDLTVKRNLEDRVSLPPSNEQDETKPVAILNTPANPPNSLGLNSNSSAEPVIETLNPYTPSAESPATPMCFRTGMFPNLNNSASEDEFNPVSRSSSNSAEDLSTIGQRAAERRSVRTENMDSYETLPNDLSNQSDLLNGSSTSLLSQGESSIDLTEELESRRESMSSVSHINSKDRMLDSLGLRGSFLMDDVKDSEELCQNLLILLFTVMWKGVEGSDTAAWKVMID